MLVITRTPNAFDQLDEAALDVRRGPDGLFVKVDRLGRRGATLVPLASQIWGLLIQHFTYRLVLDLSRIDLLNSELLGQLILLEKRICGKNGILRLCGLSSHNKDVLARCHLQDCLPVYGDERDAVFAGHRPAQPR
jgi:hypothetical protein